MLTYVVSGMRYSEREASKADIDGENRRWKRYTEFSSTRNPLWATAFPFLAVYRSVTHPAVQGLPRLPSEAIFSRPVELLK